MKKTYLALAAVAALGLSGAAFAEEGKKPAPMTDSEMDGVTAAGGPENTGLGVFTSGVVGKGGGGASSPRRPTGADGGRKGWGTENPTAPATPTNAP
jgi:hypothetical protein